MKKLIYLLVLFQCVFIFGQSLEFNKGFKPSNYSSENKDQSELVVLYNTTYTNEKGKKSVDQVILQLGNQYSKFVSVNNLRRDSLLSVFRNVKSIGANEISILGKLIVLYKKNVLKDFSTQKILVQDRISSNSYQYEEAYSKPNWILLDDKSVILGYPCKSAKLNFRGRSYMAWYTEEIPKNDGPAIFYGLPGLILKITDDNGIYDFTAIGIEKKKMNIYLRNEKNIVNISRNDFRKIERNYVENPGLFLYGKAYDESGRAIIPQFNAKQYNPLELE